MKYYIKFLLICIEMLCGCAYDWPGSFLIDVVLILIHAFMLLRIYPITKFNLGASPILKISAFAQSIFDLFFWFGSSHENLSRTYVYEKLRKT